MEEENMDTLQSQIGNQSWWDLMSISLKFWQGLIRCDCPVLMV